MTHKNNFIAAVKCGGAILREHDGIVTLPFGSEYSILLKNLDGRKACVKIDIDGQSVTEGYSVVVNPNTTTELEGFMQGTVVYNEFKFTQKTKEVVDYRGDYVDDGIVRIEVTFEKQIVEDIVHHTHIHHFYTWYPVYPQPWCPTVYPTVIYDSTVYGSDSTEQVVSNTISSSYNVNCSALSAPNPDEGITVPGGGTHQTFSPEYLGELENHSTVIIIKLVGTTDTGTIVETVISTKDKLKCPTCGHVSKSDALYCSRCGTLLR